MTTATALLTTNKPARLPRFKRASQPPGMVLTERDREIVRQVFKCRLLTREHIERLLFAPEKGKDHPTKTNSARKRLRLLFHHGYLDRVPLPTRLGHWAFLPAYSLGRQGAVLIAMEQGVSLAALKYWGKGDHQDQRASEAGVSFLQHTLGINDVRIAVTLAAARHGYQVEKWLDDFDLKSQGMKEIVSVAVGTGPRSRVPVIPDSYFVLNLGKQRAHFFLEVDRGTMSQSRWRQRVAAYQKYVASGKYEAQYHTRSLRILTVTTSNKRMENLRQSTVKAGRSGLFWFTTANDSETQDILTFPIWHRANAESNTPSCRLIEISST